MSISWRFPPLNGGNEQGYTDESIESFKGKDLIDNFTREICQNSLDAMAENESFVEVSFQQEYLKVNDFKAFRQYKDVIKQCEEYWKGRKDDKLAAFLEGAKKELRKKYIPVIIASDFNTTGLTGVKNPKNKKSVWRALAHSDGTSVKPKGSGGSFGVGKNAPFACSNVSMVFYNTYAEDGHKAFQGVARAATNSFGSEATQRIGHYLYVDDNNFNNIRPIFEDDNDQLMKIFTRDRYGTDIIVPGFIESDNWNEEIIKAVLKHFFLAILEEKLVVKVKNINIDKNTLDSLFNDFRQNNNDNDLEISWQLYQSVISDNNKIYYHSIFEKDDVQMYLLENDDFKRNIGYFRQTGMLVGKTLKRVLKRFSAVLVVRKNELSELLRQTEPARHTKWDHKIIPKSKPDDRNRAKKALDEINDFIQKILVYEDSSNHIEETDSGAAEFLPDDLEDLSQLDKNEVSKDPLKLKQVFTDDIVNIKPNRKGTSETTSIPESYGPDSAEKGKEHGSGGGQGGSVPGTGNQRDLQQGEKSGGKYRVIEPKVEYFRIVPKSIQNGIYSIKYKPEENYNNLFFKVFVVGDDTRKEPLEVEYFMREGQKVISQSKKIGPIIGTGQLLNEVIVKLNIYEKALLNVQIAEERGALND